MEGEYRALNDISLEKQRSIFWKRKLFTELFLSGQ